MGLALADRAPLVLLIDDCHWADSASLDVLNYAALRWVEERAPILVLLTLRHEALTESPDWQSWLTRFSDWLFAETDGQPLFLTETLKALFEDGLLRPASAGAAWQVDWLKFAELESGSRVLPGVWEIIRGWLDRISPPAGELLAAASVLAQEASFGYLCRVAGLEEIQAMAALDELLSRQLLLEPAEALPAPGRDPVYTFSHQKISVFS